MLRLREFWDEPTAGLDPLGHQQMMKLFITLQKEMQLTLVLVTHQMEDVARYADHVVVMEGGTVVKTGTPSDIFADAIWLKDRQLGLPHSMQFFERVRQALQMTDTVEVQPLTVEELADQLLQMKGESVERVG